MATALTIAALLLFSIAVVRVSSVAMRITGLPEHVARFQCVSALTGAGFTTTESEMIVNHPVRRRIVVALMILGNIGLVSTSATLIVGFVGADESWSAVVAQVGWLLGVLVLVFVLSTNRLIDRLLCGTIAVLLKRFTRLGRQHAHCLFQVGPGYSVYEREFDENTLAGRPVLSDPGATPLGYRRNGTFSPLQSKEALKSGDIVIWFGPDTESSENKPV